MDSLERAAIILLGLGEDPAAKVLQYLEPKHVTKVGKAMKSVVGLSKEKIHEVVTEFCDLAEKQTSLGVDSENYIRNMLKKALGENRAAALIETILSGEDSGLDSLRWLDPKSVADILRNEHPQTIATVLTYLDTEQAANVIRYFHQPRKVDLLMRMSAMDSLKPEAISELSHIVEQQLQGFNPGQTSGKGGIKSVADIVNFLDVEVEAEVLDGIGEVDTELREKIVDNMFLFENLAGLESRDMQAVLKDVSNDVLMIALRGADDVTRDFIFTNMSKRAAELLKDDLESAGPVKISEVEEAQKSVIAVARKLADNGEISLGTKGSNQLI